MVDAVVIEDPAVVATATNPLRARLLAELQVPSSAAALAPRVGLSRQKVGYHLRQLESHGLIEVEEVRKWGGLTETVFVAAARSVLVSPAVVSESAVEPAADADRMSAAFLLALAGRMVKEVGRLMRGSRTAGKRLATVSIETEVTFASPAEFAAFSDDLARSVATLAARYHDPENTGGRTHRLIAISHPRPTERSSRSRKDA